MTAKALPFSSGKVRPGQLTPRQEAAIVALVAGKSYAAVAAGAGVTGRQLRRWRADAAFAAALRAAQDEAFADTLADLRRVSRGAVATCETLLRPANRPEVRVAAARTLLSLALRANEAVMIEERLAVLERKIL